MKQLLLSTILLFSVLSAYSQSNQGFNLPPGSVLNKKAEINKDFSAKLQLLQSGNFDITKANQSEFLFQYSSSEIELMKTESPESYNYYKIADDYYNNLSPKVKAVFSVDDIWNIYMFNQKLKAQLADIK